MFEHEKARRTVLLVFETKKDSFLLFEHRRMIIRLAV